VGENVIIEREAKVDILTHLGFSKCRLSIATPKEIEYHSLQALNGKKIATSYPTTLKAYLAQNNIQAELHIISGSVEIAPNIGLADAICDLVSSGSTLFQNGLVEQEIVLTSEAVLAVNPESLKTKADSIDDILFRIKAVLEGVNNKYILFNIPNSKIDAVSRILPVLKSPTVVPLLEEGWSSLHSVINKKDFWDVIGKIKKEGAQGILVVPIENMIV
jgi:ATP phosphoribosyltransferase